MTLPRDGTIPHHTSIEESDVAIPFKFIGALTTSGDV